MRANPGGTVAPEDVIGRDDFVDYLWRILDTQSIVLTSERRIGKTSVISKMEASPLPERLCFLRDVEGFQSPTEFIEGVYSDVLPLLSKTGRAKLMVLGLLQKLGGSEIKDLKLPEIKLHWKNILSALFDDIFAEERQPVIFFWDELPLFIYNVSTNCSRQDAMELLDSLRALRQKHRNLRMVFTGSVGIHQVISRLREQGYANDPTNDMATIEVPPIHPTHGAQLANLLLVGEQIKISGDVSIVSRTISESAGHIPYYIHYLVSRMANARGQFDHHRAKECLRDLIADPNDPAHFDYYRSRLITYYGAIESTIALTILDALAPADHPLGFSELKNLVNHKLPTDEETLRRVLQTLLKDHYLSRDTNGAYSFRYSIVQAWWIYTRG